MPTVNPDTIRASGSAKLRMEPTPSPHGEVKTLEPSATPIAKPKEDRSGNRVTLVFADPYLGAYHKSLGEALRLAVKATELAPIEITVFFPKAPSESLAALERKLRLASETSFAAAFGYGPNAPVKILSVKKHAADVASLQIDYPVRNGWVQVKPGTWSKAHSSIAGLFSKRQNIGADKAPMSSPFDPAAWEALGQSGSAVKGVKLANPRPKSAPWAIYQAQALKEGRALTKAQAKKELDAKNKAA